MRALLQRVSGASVRTESHAASIEGGLVILLGVRRGDGTADAAWLARKCAGLRLFPDEGGRMNRSLLETGGMALVVSQFTLYGDADRGRRPSFTAAAPPAEAEALYREFVAALEREGVSRVETGVFQAMMTVTIVNEGPVTLLVESRAGGGVGPRSPRWPHAEPLILASASPRRSELLAAAGIPFVAWPTRVDESEPPEWTPLETARRLARRKAAAGAAAHPGRRVLGADTVVELDGRSLGKPADRAGARRMLEALSGRDHLVHTGLALAGPGGAIAEAVETTRVFFRRLSPAEIEDYLESGEAMDKAGAYGIQGRAGVFVTRIEGSCDNVIGLPVARLIDLIGEGGS